jgi:hypothetical protein
MPACVDISPIEAPISKMEDEVASEADKSPFTPSEIDCNVCRDCRVDSDVFCAKVFWLEVLSCTFFAEV